MEEIMSRHSKILVAATAGALMAIGSSSTSFANPYNSYSLSPYSYSGSSSTRGSYGHGNSSKGYNIPSRNRFARGVSDTAAHYYLVGVKEFEKGNLDRAEECFNAVLLANGLDGHAHYYLEKINVEQGDKHAANKHALALEAYISATKSEF